MDISSAIEAILFAAGDSVPVSRLSLVLDTDENTQKINDLLTEIEASMNKFHSEVSNGSTDHLTASIDAAGAETLGVPNAQIVAKSYLKMGLGYRTASSCEQELSDFLSLFGISYDSKIAVR